MFHALWASDAPPMPLVAFIMEHGAGYDEEQETEPHVQN
jgi:hypothetical protein